MPRDLSKLLKGYKEAVLIAGNDVFNPNPFLVNQFPMLYIDGISDEGMKLRGSDVNFKDHTGQNLNLGTEIELEITGIEGDSRLCNIIETFLKNEVTLLLLPDNIANENCIKLKGYGNFTLEQELYAKGKKKFALKLSNYANRLVSMYENLFYSLDSGSSIYKYVTFNKMIPRDGLICAFLPWLGNFGVPGKLFDFSLNRIVCNLQGNEWRENSLIFYNSGQFSIDIKSNDLTVVAWALCGGESYLINSNDDLMIYVEREAINFKLKSHLISIGFTYELFDIVLFMGFSKRGNQVYYIIKNDWQTNEGSQDVVNTSGESLEVSLMQGGGMLYLFLIYDRALTPNEMYSIYNQTKFLTY